MFRKLPSLVDVWCNDFIMLWAIGCYDDAAGYTRGMKDNNECHAKK